LTKTVINMLSRKFTLSLVLVVIVVMQVNAQQLPQYSNYMINNFAMNPAVAGSNPYFEGISNNRYQWVGLTDAPRTYILTAQGPLKSMNVGLGGSIYTDIVGPTRRIGASFSYAYHLKLNEKVKLSMGLSAGVVQFTIDGSQIALRDPGDAVISSGLQSVISPDFGAGLYAYSTDKKWYVGLSVPQIMQSKINFVDLTTSTLSRLNRHYYITAGYRYKLNDKYVLEPSTCIKYATPAPVQFDLGVRLIYQDKMWLGTVYRYLDASAILLGYKLNQNMSFAYSYDFTTSNIRRYSSGTHELMIAIRFHKVQPKATPIVEPASSEQK
jgi:type IX secretion system PorP/SprF family membrane protein